jgi:hypothetical protein
MRHRDRLGPHALRFTGENDPGHAQEKTNSFQNPSKAQKRSCLCHDVILLEEAAEDFLIETRDDCS